MCQSVTRDIQLRPSDDSDRGRGVVFGFHGESVPKAMGKKNERLWKKKETKEYLCLNKHVRGGMLGSADAVHLQQG